MTFEKWTSNKLFNYEKNYDYSIIQQKGSHNN
jgi:hypothetical protein